MQLIPLASLAELRLRTAESNPPVLVQSRLNSVPLQTGSAYDAANLCRGGCCPGGAGGAGYPGCAGFPGGAGFPGSPGFPGRTGDPGGLCGPICFCGDGRDASSTSAIS